MDRKRKYETPRNIIKGSYKRTPIKGSLPQLSLRLLLTSASVCLLLGLFSLGLFAQQKPTSPQAKTNPSSTDPIAADDDTTALLPSIPTPLGPSVAGRGGIVGPLPGEQVRTQSADNAKNLYGFLGSFYNTANLTGRVVVLDFSVYTWPTPNWKVTGLLRNQTRLPVHVTSLTAHLLGPRGELLATATSSLPVKDLRPGEPGPFMIAAPIAGDQVKSVDWHIGYRPAEAASRFFEFTLGRQEGGSRYYLDGRIRNSAKTVARGVHVTVAWLDLRSNKVVYTAPAMIRLFDDPSTMVDTWNFNGGDTEQFLFITTDSVLIPLLSDAEPLLWGVSQ